MPSVETGFVGIGRRPDAMCPVCHCLDRHRLLYRFLQARTQLFEERTRLLHVAPEWSLREAIEALPSVEYVTADLYNQTVDVNLDLCQLPFEDGTFDAIMCNHVLEHVEDDGLGMRELHRVLREGGWAILQVPFSERLETTYEDDAIVEPEARTAAYGQADHVRLYGLDYADRLRDAGFDVSVFRWTEADREFGGAANRLALDPREPVFFCAKQPASDAVRRALQEA